MIKYQKLCFVKDGEIDHIFVKIYAVENNNSAFFRNTGF